MTTDLEALMVKAIERRISNNWEHKHHEGCIHNMPPEEQIAMRGKSVEWWMAIVGSMPVQITPDDWEEGPL
jgi:hypothetical protein